MRRDRYRGHDRRRISEAGPTRHTRGPTMKRSLALVGILCAASLLAHANEPSYRYVSLDQAVLPDSFVVQYVGLSWNGRAYGVSSTVGCEDGQSPCVTSIITYHKGKTERVIDNAFPFAVNKSGT